MIEFLSLELYVRILYLWHWDIMLLKYCVLTLTLTSPYPHCIAVLVPGGEDVHCRPKSQCADRRDRRCEAHPEGGLAHLSGKVPR